MPIKRKNGKTNTEHAFASCLARQYPPTCDGRLAISRSAQQNYLFSTKRTVRFRNCVKITFSIRNCQFIQNFAKVTISHGRCPASSNRHAIQRPGGKAAWSSISMACRTFRPNNTSCMVFFYLFCRLLWQSPHATTAERQVFCSGERCTNFTHSLRCWQKSPPTRLPSYFFSVQKKG